MSKQAKTRSCIICKQNFLKNDLLRFVTTPDNDIMLDVYQKAPARGSYVCNDDTCLDKAINKKVIIKKKQANDNANLKEIIVKSLESKIKQDIIMLKKANRIEFGADNVLELIKKHKTNFVLVTNDLSNNSKDKIISLVSNCNIELLETLDKKSLEQMASIANCSVFALKPSGLSVELSKTLKFYKKLV